MCHCLARSSQSEIVSRKVSGSHRSIICQVSYEIYDIIKVVWRRGEYIICLIDLGNRLPMAEVFQSFDN